MTVAVQGEHEGTLHEVSREREMDAPVVELANRSGRIHSDLTIGTDVTAAMALRASEGLSSLGCSDNLGIPLC
jgi:hypothetical protein